ncbi:prolyl oligopeptidase family serine peptidase [Antribacter sp. KLBMP9083]|uniref:Prolyl oligopeptidase family serine peptidase n=1 Tax=Antribacter soli TaxID=2910976 RepID=A0AA41QGI8_9MICO|nr:PHB depolymerase family esterase [Antribacter soli]MCF4121782.1 prolyl oligopeptidase family serine peptidase [Antribacter soli]
MRRAWSVMAAALLLAACTGPAEPDGAAPSPGPALTRAAGVDLPAGDTTVELDGGPRTYTVHVPETLGGPAPLVLALHPLSGSGAQLQALSGWDDLADAEGFVVVYPDGIGGSWNAGGCCGAAVQQQVDDVAFLTAVLVQVEASLDIDPDRVYVTGFSNGAMMSYRLACETSRFAALAPVGGDLRVPCADPQPASVLHVHGLADSVVPFQSSDTPWLEAGECGEAVATAVGPVHTSTAACADDRTVEVVTLTGVGHVWPSTADGFDTLSAVWAFFEEHPAP